MKKEVVLDFETVSHTDLGIAGAFRYWECPTTEPICLAYSYQESAPYCWVPEYEHRVTGRLLWELAEDPEVRFIAHNALFEIAGWQHYMEPRGWPKIARERWHCTMAVCAAKGLPLSLEEVCKALNLKNQKDMEGSQAIKKLSRYSPSGRHRGRTFAHDATLKPIAIEYCMQDIFCEIELHKRLGYLSSIDRAAWILNLDMNLLGIGIDLEYVDAARKIISEFTPTLIKEFTEITGHKPGQIAKVKQWLHEQGCKVPDLRAETVAGILGQTAEGETVEGDDFGLRHKDLTFYVERVLDIRQLLNSASIKKLSRIRECISSDGRVRGTTQYHGTHPGRPAGRLFQPYNFPRGTIKIGKLKPDPDLLVATVMARDPAWVEAIIGPPIETIVSGLRHMIVAKRGHVLISGDYAGIQARTVLAVSGQHDKAQLMATGKDVYLDMAEAIYKRKLDKEHDAEPRQHGKNTVLGCGFGMGWKKFKLKYARHHSDEFCEETIHAYRYRWAPCVPKLWKAWDDAAHMTVYTGQPHEAFGVEYRLEDIWLTARLPSGRKIWYAFPTKCRRSMPWDADDVREAWRYQTTKSGRSVWLYPFGGSLTENNIMGMECDIQRHGMISCRKHGWEIPLEVYDEIVCEVPEWDADEKTLAQMMLDVPEWVKQYQIPVAVETWQGSRYRK